MIDYYSERAEQANSYDYSDKPWQATVTRLRDVIELQAKEIIRLQKCIRALEREGIGCVLIPAEVGHQPAHTGRAVW